MEYRVLLLPLRAVALLPVVALASFPAHAVPVTMNGLIVPSCVLTVSTGGLLGVSSDGGRQIGSELTGGSAAVLAIVATGAAPTITVGAPTMSLKPAAYAGSPAVSVRYTSTGGANQAYTSSNSSYTSTNVLGDTLTINMKAVDNDGFVAGSYQLQTNVTCQQ